MCGIAGVVSGSARSASRDRERVEAMLAAIHHRGPDASGVRTLTGPGGQNVALGAVRLRIIDLDPSADQPLSNAAGDVWTAFNGEIYNFRELRAELEADGFVFKSSSDTECLVHLYRQLDGDAAAIASRLRGMFAFAIFDTTTGRLIVVRDRLGIKPLYWATTDGGFTFCSEQRALARAGVVSGSPNIDAIGGYLAKGIVPSGSTLIADVHELGPGELITWDGGAPRIETWWTPTIATRADLADPAAAQHEFDQVVADAVERHLVADRTVGVFLSSGTDSSAVASLAGRSGAHKSLTVTFPDNPALDEGSEAAATAQRLGLDHTAVPVTASDALTALPGVLASFDSPTADGFNSWLISRAAKDAGLVVVLSGLGGDELLAGYRTFRDVPRLARILGAVKPIPAPARQLIARGMRLSERTRPWARAFDGGTGRSRAYHLMRRLFDDSEIASLGLAPPQLFGVAETHEAIDAVTLLELKSYLRDQLLRDSDMTSMAHSIELRVPLLDDRLVATALALPPDVRVNGKQMLATAAGLGPRPPKRPFALPMQHWVSTSLRDTVRDALLDDSLPFADVLPSAFRRQLWDDVEHNRVHWAKPWSVAVLRLWPQANGFNW